MRHSDAATGRFWQILVAAGDWQAAGSGYVYVPKPGKIEKNDNTKQLRVCYGHKCAVRDARRRS
jgi:hypothetical protein